MKLLVSWLRKSDFQGRSRSLNLKLGLFAVFWGQNLKICKPGQIIYQNEALGLVVKKRDYRGHSRSFKSELKVISISSIQNLKIFKCGKGSFWSRGYDKMVSEVTREKTVHTLTQAKQEAKKKSPVLKLP